jgi:hypothetical protein
MVIHGNSQTPNGNYRLHAPFHVNNVSIPNGSVMGSSQGVEIGNIEAKIISGSINVVNDSLQFIAPTSPGWDKQSLTSTRSFKLSNFGDVLGFSVIKNSAGTTKFLAGATAGSYNALPSPVNRLSGVEFHSNGDLYTDYKDKASLIGSYSHNTNYQIKIVSGGYNSSGKAWTTGNKSDYRYGHTTFMKGGAYTDWTLIHKGLPLSISNCNALGTNPTLGWEDYSDGSNKTIIKNNALYILDSSSVLGNQTKARTQQFFFSDVMSIIMDLDLVQLNNSANMDGLGTGFPDDGIGSTPVSQTSDNTINRSGLSFAIVHPTLPLRCIFSIVKAQNYSSTGNVELWKVYDSNAQTHFTFERIYSGKDIPLNQRFSLQVDYSLASDTSYSVTIKVGNKILVDNQFMGMNSTYGGQKSLLFQCKGTSTEPVEFYVHKLQVLNVGGRFSFLNYDANGKIDEVHIKDNNDDVLIPSSFITNAQPGNTTTHQPNNCLIDLLISSLPSSNTLEVAFRKIDDNNYYKVSVDNTGNISLISVVNGTSTTLQTINSGVTAASRLILKIDRNNKLEIWNDNVLRGTYNSLNLFPSGSVIKILSNGNGGEVTEVITMPVSSSNISYVLSDGGGGVILPVNFVTLKGYESDHSNTLEWDVTNEAGILTYEIGRSIDGARFSNIGLVAVAASNGSNAKTYSWIDAKPVSGVNYYRISLAGLNGDKKYSNIVKVARGKGSPAINIYPNPSSGIFTLQLNNLEKGLYTFRLLNNAGQTTLTQLIEHSGGSGSRQIKLPNSASNGLYRIELIKENIYLIEKVVVNLNR